jgi:hypothetical protein
MFALITISFEFVPLLIHRLVCPLMCHFGIYTLFSDQEDNTNSTDAGIYKVKSDDYKEIFVTVEMDGKSVKMEVDTGSAISVIPKKQFD